MSETSTENIEAFLLSHGPFDAPSIFGEGDCAGDWEIRAFLGRGGSAEVYRAENKTTGLVAALKVLCKTEVSAQERFRREAQLVAQTRSSAFPKFYGAGCDNGRFFIAEELLEPKPLPTKDVDVARFVIDVASAVEELHRQGFVHRDIKPRNVMMRPGTGEIVLVDMGLAKECGLAAQANNAVSIVDGKAVGVGTPGFSAPEQFTGGRIGPATDIHALGMLANACFDGKPPRAWAKIIRRSTSSIPEQRYANVPEFARAVRRRHAVRLLAAGLVILLVAATVITLLVKLQNPAFEATVDDVKPPQWNHGNFPAEKRLAKEILNATYDMFYGGNTNMDKKASIELMKKKGVPSY